MGNLFQTKKALIWVLIKISLLFIFYLFYAFFIRTSKEDFHTRDRNTAFLKNQAKYFCPKIFFYPDFKYNNNLLLFVTQYF